MMRRRFVKWMLPALALAVLFLFGGSKARAEGTIQSVQISDVQVWEANYGWSGSGETKYKHYYVSPREIRVKMDGETYEGSFDDVIDSLGYPTYTIQDPQSFENQWGVGTHQVGFTINGFSVNYNVVVRPNPIESVTVKDLYLLTEQYSYVGSGSNRYKHYNTEPNNITVTAGGRSFSGEPWEVEEELSDYYWDDYESFPYSGYSVTDPQSVSNQWGEGTHQAGFTFCGFQTEYNVIIQGSYVQSVTAKPLHLYAGQYSYSYDERNRQYKHYNLTPDEITVVAGGETFTGTPYSVYWDVCNSYYYRYGEELDLQDYSVEDPQSYANQWGTGTHQTTFSFGELTTDLSIVIEATPITSLTANPIYRWAGDYSYNWDERNQQYKHYNIEPKTITVVAGGETYSGSPSEVAEDLGYTYDFYFDYEISNDPQVYGNEWGVGTHQAGFTMDGFTVNYDVIIEATPIKSITVDPVHRWSGDYNLWDDEYSREYKHYDIQPAFITVVDDAGEVFEGSPDDVAQELRYVYGFYFDYEVSNDSQTYANQWGVGTHQAEFTMDGFTVNYDVVVEASPIESLTVTPVFQWSGKYIQRTDSYNRAYKHYDIEPETITVVAGGETYSGSPSEVARNLGYTYDFYFDYEVSNDPQAYGNEWGVGTHQAGFTMDGFTVNYDVIIGATPIESITAEPVYRWSGNYSWKRDETNRQYKHYSLLWPDIITVVAEGQTYRGSLEAVTSSLKYHYGYYFNHELTENPQDPQNYENQWGVGTHQAFFTLDGFTVDYNMIIEATPIESITVDTLYLWAGEYNWEVEDDDYQRQYRSYPTMPKSITVVAQGQTFTGSPADVARELGYHNGFTFEYDTWDSQSYGNEWEVGSHEAGFIMDGFMVPVPVVIQPIPITSVTVDSLSCLAWNWTNKWDGNVKFRHYSVDPAKITVVAAGKTYSGTLWQVESSLEGLYGYIDWEIQDPQNSGNVWGVGTHEAAFTMEGVSATYTLEIKTPVESLTVDPLVLEEDDYTWKEDTQNRDYRHYNLNPASITVVAEGKTYSGSISEVADALYKAYTYTNSSSFWKNEWVLADPQSYENQWGSGQYENTLYFGGVEASYQITIETEALPVQIQLTDMGGYELSGGVIRVVDENNNVMASWASARGALMEISLKPGSYTLQEVVAPEGYQCITTNIQFTVSPGAEGNLILLTKVVEPAGAVDLVDGVMVLQNELETKTAEISDQPISCQGYVGETVYFSVGASGEALNFQWQLSKDGGETWTNSGATGCNTESLAVKVLGGYNKLQYRCLVTDAYGTVLTSDSATLTVLPKITTQPADQSAKVGEAAKFTVAASGAGLKKQWQLSKDGGKTWTDSGASGNKTFTLSVVKVAAGYNNLQYRCVITDANGVVLNSAPATLTVQKSAPVITTQPADQSGKVGETAKFTVAATGTGLKKQWQYSKDGGKTWVNSGASGNKTFSLSFSITAGFNKLLYRCVITDSSGTTVNSNPATLTVTPVLKTNPVKAVSAKVGDKVTLSVNATGAGLKKQWQYSEDGKTWKNSGAEGSKTFNLVLKASTGFNKLQYRCVITDANGVKLTSTACTLTIDPVLKSHPANKTASVGETAKFTVSATGASLKYQWYYSNDGGKTWTKSQATGSRQATLNIAVKKGYNGLMYRCVITDANGNVLTTNGAKLTVK